MRAALWQAPLASGIPPTQEHEYFFSCPGLLLVCKYSSIIYQSNWNQGPSLTWQHTHFLGGFSNILALAISGVDAQKGIVIRESEKKFNKCTEVHIYQYAWLQADELQQTLPFRFWCFCYFQLSCVGWALMAVNILIFLDHPKAYLDQQNCYQIRAKILEAIPGSGIFYISLC